MAPPNVTWHSIIQQAAVSSNVLKQSEVVRNVQNILQTNMSVASSLGPPFLSQMRIIYVQMLNVYKCAKYPPPPPPPPHTHPTPPYISLSCFSKFSTAIPTNGTEQYSLLSSIHSACHVAP